MTSDEIRIDGTTEFIPSENRFTRIGQHPIGFWFVFSGELAEHASYYGMRTLLALYMIDVLGFSEAAGTTVMKAFMASCYLTPFSADEWRRSTSGATRRFSTIRSLTSSDTSSSVALRTRWDSLQGSSCSPSAPASPKSP